MSRKDIKALNYIRYICELANRNEKIMYSRARMVLGIYRHVCWLTAGRAEEGWEELMDTLGGHCPLKTICRKANSPGTVKGVRAVCCPSQVIGEKQEQLLLFLFPEQVGWVWYCPRAL